MRLTEVRVDPRPVAIVRIGLGIAAVINGLEVSSILHLVAEGRLRFPVLAWVPEPSAPAVAVYAALAVLAGLALVVGYRTSVAASLTVVLGAAAMLWDQQAYSNHRLLVTLLTAYLIFARSETAWSVWRNRPKLVDVPWWPQLLMMTQLSACYLFAALSKINTVYLDGGVFGGWLWLALPSALLRVIAVCSVLTELFLAFGLWFRKTRYVAVAAGCGLHLSIVMLMASDNLVLFAFAMACVPVYGLFLTRPGLRDGGSRGQAVDAARAGSVRS